MLHVHPNSILITDEEDNFNQYFVLKKTFSAGYQKLLSTNLYENVSNVFVCFARVTLYY